MKAHISHTAKSTAQGLVWGIQPGSADWQALEAAAAPFGMALRAVAPSQADSTVSRLLGGASPPRACRRFLPWFWRASRTRRWMNFWRH